MHTEQFIYHSSYYFMVINILREIDSNMMYILELFREFKKILEGVFF